MKSERSGVLLRSRRSGRLRSGRSGVLLRSRRSGRLRSGRSGGAGDFDLLRSFENNDGLFL